MSERTNAVTIESRTALATFAKERDAEVGLTVDEVNLARLPTVATCWSH
jgi:hypothetical protein